MYKDYYATLGLAHNAEDVVVRAIFRLLAHRYHPDKCLDDKENANRMMSEINEAYRHLLKNQPLSLQGVDYYQCLGLLPHADAQMIYVAYEALIQKYRHVPNRLVMIQQAYQVLSDSRQRARYDRRSVVAHLSPVRAKPGLNLWKIYIAYNVGVYVVMATLLGLCLLLTS